LNPPKFKTMEQPDISHFKAAEGWLELGNWQEANEELERITPANWPVCDSSMSYSLRRSACQTFIGECPPIHSIDNVPLMVSPLILPL